MRVQRKKRLIHFGETRESFTEEMTTGQGLKNEWNFYRQVKQEGHSKQGTCAEEGVKVNKIE